MATLRDTLLSGLSAPECCRFLFHRQLTLSKYFWVRLRHVDQRAGV